MGCLGKREPLKQKSFWELRDGFSGCWIWRKLLKLRDLASDFFQWDIGNGKRIKFWWDKWGSEKRLIDRLGMNGPTILGVSLNASLAKAKDTLETRNRNQTDQTDKGKHCFMRSKTSWLIRQTRDKILLFCAKVQTFIQPTSYLSAHGIKSGFQMQESPRPKRSGFLRQHLDTPSSLG